MSYFIYKYLEEKIIIVQVSYEMGKMAMFPKELKLGKHRVPFTKGEKSWRVTVDSSESL